jgi:TetR/AcrR family transcriptional repressor of nem operon
MNRSPTTADDILACTRKLVVARGYNGFSYADVAEVVGIRKASIHHHFPSKVDLVRTLLRRYREEAEAGLTHLENAIPHPLELLRAYVQYWKSCIGDASAPFCVCALLASELPVLPEDVALEVRSYFRWLSAWLTSAFERGLERGVMQLRNAPQAEAEIFMAAVHGAMLSARAYGDTGTFGAIMDPQLERISAN